MNPQFEYHEQQQYEQEQQQQQLLIEDALKAEEQYFADYDHAMYSTYDDDYRYYGQEELQLHHHQQQRQQHQQQEQEQEEYDYDEDTMDMDDDVEEDEEYNYEDDALLKLIVGVQSYISDLASVGANRQDSPLLDLQYKMYVYLKQRVNDMGIDANTLL